jgi:alkylated DNA repair dioxygenase AlkB
MPEQLALFDSPRPAEPEGLAYAPELITPEAEAALAAEIERLPFAPFAFQGWEGKRRVVSFGWRYDFTDARLHPAEPLPAWLEPLRERAAEVAGVAAEAFVHALVTEYARGAGIGWHRDRPQFGDVVGVSLLSPCTLRFRRREGAGWSRATLLVEPRSAYLLRGLARTEWEHSIAAVDALRYSITFRTLRPSASGRPV